MVIIIHIKIIVVFESDFNFNFNCFWLIVSDKYKECRTIFKKLLKCE